MSYSARIMNLPASGEPSGGSMAYKLGHRDARHAAAEIAAEADARLEVAQRMADALAKARANLRMTDHAVIAQVDAALAEWEKQ